MKRMVCVWCLLIFCLQMSLLSAQEPGTDIQQFILRVQDPAAPVARETFQEIAVAAYLILNEIPFRGLQDQSGEIEQIIRLEQTLMTHPGMLERRFALNLQWTIDAALLMEVNRRALARNGQEVHPAYHDGSVHDDTVTSLLAQNALAEVDHANYLLQRSGRFSQYFHRKQFDAEDLLSGNAMRRLPSELSALCSWMYGRIHAPVKMDRKTTEDFLVVFTLTGIDRARDIRMLWEVFRQAQRFYLPGEYEKDWKMLKKVVAASPRRRSLITGQKKTAMTVVFADHGAPNGYADMLLDCFLQYFGDMPAIAAQHVGIFSWYCQSEGVALEDVLNLKAGYWLEFDE